MMEYKLDERLIMLEQSILLKSVSILLDQLGDRASSFERLILIDEKSKNIREECHRLFKEDMTPDMIQKYQYRALFLKEMIIKHNELTEQITNRAKGSHWANDETDRIANEIDDLQQKISNYKWYFMDGIERLEWAVAIYFMHKKMNT